MARIAGVDLPKSKRMEIALTYIYGIGRSTSRDILGKAGVSLDLQSDDLSDDDVAKIRQVHRSELQSRRRSAARRDRQISSGTSTWDRIAVCAIARNLPVHGQRTHTNARTRKGPRKTVAGKKPAPSKG